MADLDDITSLILRAQAVEKTNPNKAHARYEIAERQLDEYLLLNFGVSGDVLENNPDNYLSKRFIPYYATIKEGYARLIDCKDVQASSL